MKNKITLNKISKILTEIFNAPYNGLVDFSSYIASKIKDENDIEDEFITSLSNYDLILIEHKGFNIIGTTIDYELNNYHKVKACYFLNANIRPILVTKENIKEMFGDIRLFVSKYEKELLHIAREIKSSCVLTVINIFNMAKELGLSLDKKNLNEIIKNHNYKMQVLAHSWF